MINLAANAILTTAVSARIFIFLLDLGESTYYLLL
jgi:hypothetical protein